MHKGDTIRKLQLSRWLRALAIAKILFEEEGYHTVYLNEIEAHIQEKHMQAIRCIHCLDVVEGVTFTSDNRGELIAFAHRSCHERVIDARTCPTCDTILRPPAFMHIRPEGYVCEAWRIYYSEERDGLKAIAKIL